MVELIVLGSGSKGNATLVRSGRGAVLVDAGLSCRQLVARLEAAGQDPARIDAILVTHEHVDHVGGLPVFLKRYPTPVYMTERTAEAAAARVARAPQVVPVVAGEAFDAGPFRVTAVPVPHDAVDPVAYLLERDGVRVGQVTDLGHVTTLVEARFAGCHALVLEANHDRDMLLDGPYPWPTKQRVASRVGHLSNDHAAAALARLVGEETCEVVLAHLSEVNNDPGLAEAAAGAALADRGRRPRVHCARQHAPSRAVRL
ncbi:MAG: MBL fold metallo-hydrolase [Acidobacteria bacterium]|nr:MAG: MBL fold metallo-hydrolase [Acidobacteriota bacterium]